LPYRLGTLPKKLVGKHLLSYAVEYDENEEGDETGNAQHCERNATNNVENGLRGWEDMGDSGATRVSRRE